MGAQVALALPAKLRPVLRKPFGVLYKGTGKDTIQKLLPDMSSPTKLISVGDVTTFYLLESDIIPDVCVVDDRTRREPASNHVVLGTNHTAFTTISVDNPPGVITEDLVDAIEDAIRSDQHVRLFVRGEEDLAALPAILMAPIGSVVLYGQPNEGVVLVKITESKKDEIRNLLDQIIDEYAYEGQLDSVRRKLDGY